MLCGGAIRHAVTALSPCQSTVRSIRFSSIRVSGSREGDMLTRRGFASCAICAITGFIATEASARGAGQPNASPAGVTRKVLSKTDGPMAGYETLLVEAEIDAGVTVGRHTHPGVESAYVLEGGFELPIQGQ